MTAQGEAGAAFAALEASWPPAETFRRGPWRLRRGDGGGKRVSAATAEAPARAEDIALAEAAMRDMGQTPLFMLREDEEGLDAKLAERGYRLVDPTAIHVGAIADLAATPVPPMRCFPHWPPLAIVAQLWADADIGPQRRAVMARVQGPKAALLGRDRDRAAGAAFVACQGSWAVLHALQVVPAHRRTGLGRDLVRAAAIWAAGARAVRLAVAVTQDNVAATALYAALGMRPCARYHYRQATQEPADDRPAHRP